MKKIISIILVAILLLSTLLLSACFNFESYPESMYPEGYTCGFGLQPGSPLEYWWVETYEECVDAIELLKSHGSTFLQDEMFIYEGDLFDTKYCFSFSGEKNKIKFGDNPFDRYVENVVIEVYAFFDDVSLDEINRSYVSRYEAYKFGASPAYIENCKIITIDQLDFIDWSSDGYYFYKDVYYNDSIAFSVTSCFSVKDDINAEEEKLKMNDEIIKTMIKSGQMIKLNDI